MNKEPGRIEILPVDKGKVCVEYKDASGRILASSGPLGHPKTAYNSILAMAQLFMNYQQGLVHIESQLKGKKEAV